MFDRLIIGTANWRKPYNGCICKDQDEILEYAAKNGFWGVELADAYGTTEMRVPIPLRCLMKTIPLEGDSAIYLAHNPKDFGQEYDGISIYEPLDLPNGKELPRWIELPYSIMDRRNDFVIENAPSVIIARSIYLRGKCLEKTTPQECLKFVLCNPKINLVVIGVDSLDMLKRNTDFIHEWESYRCDDGEVVDPRRWAE